MDYGKTATGYSSGFNQASYAEPSAPMPMGRLPEAQQTTEKLVEVLHVELSQLEQRLSLVLRPPMPMPSTAEQGRGARQSEPCALANAAETVNGRLQNAIAMVQSLASRVDL